MTANIELDDKLVDEARAITGVQQEKELVAAVFDEFIKMTHRKSMLEFMDSDCWEGDIDEMRLNRSFA
jgi:Arc/MetJ family transcription regulator